MGTAVRAIYTTALDGSNNSVRVIDCKSSMDGKLPQFKNLSFFLNGLRAIATGNAEKDKILKDQSLKSHEVGKVGNLSDIFLA